MPPFVTCPRLRPKFWLLGMALALSVLTVSGTSAAETEKQPAPREPRVHDPSTIIKFKDSYYLFATGMGVLSQSSSNLLVWQSGPRVVRDLPAWAEKAVPQNRGHLWAPDVIPLSNRFLLYYSVSTFGKRTSAIGLATNSTMDPAAPGYSWVDQGMVVQTSEASDHNAIDPSVLLDRDGRLWMAYGSFWSGIKLIQLDPATGLRLDSSTQPIPLAWHASIEAPCLYRRSEDYYLFVNWGRCCVGTNSTYEVRVGRSRQVTGPYLDKDGKDLLKGGGTPFLSTSGKRIGPGHIAILQGTENDLFSYHYYDRERNGQPTLEIAPLQWTDDGWPRAGEPLRK